MVNQSANNASADDHLAEEMPKPIKACCAWTRYFLVAVLSGVGAAITGSLLVALFLAYVNGTFRDFGPMILIITFYAGAFVLPLSALVAFPLMLVLRDASNWAWILACAAAAVGCAAVLAYVFEASVFVKPLACTGSYAAVYAVFAISLRRLFVRACQI